MKASKTRSRTILPLMAIAAAAGICVAGCSRGGAGDDEQVEANAISRPEVNVPLPAEPAVPAITDAANNGAEADEVVTLNDIISEEAQMMEDADATGMTSRTAAGEAQQDGVTNEAAEAPVAQ